MWTSFKCITPTRLCSSILIGTCTCRNSQHQKRSSTMYCECIYSKVVCDDDVGNGRDAARFKRGSGGHGPCATTGRADCWTTVAKTTKIISPACFRQYDQGGRWCHSCFELRHVKHDSHSCVSAKPYGLLTLVLDTQIEKYSRIVYGITQSSVICSCDLRLV
jgi:hypothetical protein